MEYKCLTAVRHSGRSLPCDWHIAMNQLIRPTNAGYCETFRKGMPPDDALNDMAEEALHRNVQYIFYVDDDTQLPPMTIMALMTALENADADVMACGGIYCTKTNPPEPIVYKEPNQGAFWNWKVGEVFPCFALGMGSLMIKTEIFRKMSKPWFKWLRSSEEMFSYPEAFPETWSTEPLAKYGGCTDDIFFFRKLKNLGYKALAHGGVLPIHWDQAGKSYWLPADTIPTRGVEVNGKPFGWVDPDYCQAGVCP